MTEQPKRGGIGVLATIGTFHFAMYRHRPFC
jgi:hypothetical protein